MPDQIESVILSVDHNEDGTNEVPGDNSQLQQDHTCRSSLYIRDYTHEGCMDDIKYKIIQCREPENHFKFPSTQYKDKRRHTGYINWYYNRDWFNIFDFVCYSKAEYGLYCVGCVLFPDTSHHRSSKLITEPYKNWKDACEDLKTHAQCEYHCNSMAKLWAFRNT